MQKVINIAVKVGAHAAFPMAALVLYHNGWLSWFPGLGGPKVNKS